MWSAMLSGVIQLDHFLRAWVVGHRLPFLDWVMWSLSIVGRGGMLWLAIAATLVVTRRARPLMLAQLVFALMLTAITADCGIRPAVNRARPFVATPQIPVIGSRPSDASFPSGHTATAFAGAFIVSRMARPLAPLWWALAAAIAYSRVYLGVHYTIDLAGGALLGLCAGAASAYLWRDRHT